MTIPEFVVALQVLVAWMIALIIVTTICGIAILLVRRS